MAHQNCIADINESADNVISEADIHLLDELDIEEPIRKWAEYTYKKTTFGSRGVDDDDDDNDDDSDGENKDDVENEHGEDVVYELKLDKIRIRTGKPSFTQTGNPKSDNLITQSLFETVYQNESEKMQAFSFKVERKTESTAVVEMNGAVTCGGFTKPLLDMMTIPLPQEVHTAGFGKYLRPTKAYQSFKEELKWSVDNLVNVPPKKQTTAAMVVSEKQYEASFSVNITFQGKVLVNVNDGKTGRLIRMLEGSIEEIMKHFGPKQMDGLSINGKKVEFQTEGNCKFVFGVQQNVTIKSQDYKEQRSFTCCIL